MNKSHLEQFCTDVALETFEVDSVDNNNKGIDIAAILAFIETLATVIQSISSMCPNKAKLAQIAKNPSFVQRILFRSEVRKSFNESDSWQIRRAHIRAAQNAITKASRMEESELVQLVEEIDLIENSII